MSPGGGVSTGGGPRRRLVGDIGGTNARFAIAQDGKLGDIRVLPAVEHPTLEHAVKAFLAMVPAAEQPHEAAFAVAGPVTGDRMAFTNHAWSFSIAELRTALGLERLQIVNDFSANALAVPYLADSELQRIGGGTAVPDQPIGILGPGTGLGVSGLIPVPPSAQAEVKPPARRWVPLAGEGGHITMAARTDQESRLLDHLRSRFDHVSAERVLSGQGLVHIYEGLAALEGKPSTGYTPAQITDPAQGASDPLCNAAVEMFCAMLGTVASDLALTLGARGGIYLAGGILPRLGTRLIASPFRGRFEAKGRFSPYLQAIPTRLITHPSPAMVGLANLP
ncbi:MAG TPA: glucokinase [Stellaceae bacterium]|nr:glucokinase [Stellaceae bacterium]